MDCQRCDEAPQEKLLDGIRLFNAGEYFECHEVLEEIWRAESDSVRDLYQGILQIGVAFHHLRRDNWRGAIKLLLGGIDKVGRFMPRCMDIDTASLHGHAIACLELLQELGPGRIPAFDWSLVPKIRVSTSDSETYS